MNSQKHIPPNLLNSYVDTNRDKIDSALVSLRIIKQIDNFMDYHEISQKNLSNKLDVSESYVSQLMSGTKKINVNLISKFEKRYNVEFDFKIKIKNKKIPHSIFETINLPIELRSRNHGFSNIKTFTFNSISSTDYIVDTEYTEL